VANDGLPCTTSYYNPQEFHPGIPCPDNWDIIGFCGPDGACLDESHRCKGDTAVIDPSCGL
jgi:hypothetical protein